MINSKLQCRSGIPLVKNGFSQLERHFIEVQKHVFLYTILPSSHRSTTCNNGVKFFLIKQHQRIHWHFHFFYLETKRIKTVKELSVSKEVRIGQRSITCKLRKHQHLIHFASNKPLKILLNKWYRIQLTNKCCKSPVIGNIYSGKQ